MYKALILAAAVVAQTTMPPMSVPPMTMRVPPGSAGALPAGPGDGITVTGSGSATAQATDAQVTLRVSTRNNALTLDARTLAPIVDALVRAGVDRSDIGLPMYIVGQARTNSAAITARVHRPTLAMLQQGMLTIANAFAATPDLLLNNAEVRLSADNCTALQHSAEANAIANARSSAQFLAKQVQAQTGPVLALEERGAAAGWPDACTQYYSIGPFGLPPQVNTGNMLTVKISTTVMIRFAIVRENR